MSFHFIKKSILKIYFTLSLVFLSSYLMYCLYINPKYIAHYCIENKCISVIHHYKGSGVNYTTYARIYDGFVMFRFQMKDNYAELLMEEDILISKKILNDKFIIYGALPKVYGHLKNLEIRKSGYIDRDNNDYILSGSLKFNTMF